MKNYKAKKEIILTNKSTNTIHSFWMRRDSFGPFWHFHPEIELTFISRGTGVRIVGDSIQPFKENDLVLIGSNLPHNWISIENSDYCEAFVLQFSPVIFQKSSELVEINSLIKRAEKGIHFRSLTESIFQIINEYNEKPDALKFSSLIETLYELTQSENAQYLASDNYRIPTYNYKSQQRFEKVTEFVITNIDKKITLQEIASIANMSRESFSRWFKKTSGSTFINYLNKTKVEVACHLLIHSDDHINEIAYKVGYESQSQFHRSFKYFKNISPLKFRKQQVG